MTKKTKTPTTPSTDCPEVRTQKGSLFCVPSARRKACEKMTERAARSRRRSKLFRLCKKLSRHRWRAVNAPTGLFILKRRGGGSEIVCGGRRLLRLQPP